MDMEVLNDASKGKICRIILPISHALVLSSECGAVNVAD